MHTKLRNFNIFVLKIHDVCFGIFNYFVTEIIKPFITHTHTHTPLLKLNRHLLSITFILITFNGTCNMINTHVWENSWDTSSCKWMTAFLTSSITINHYTSRF